MDNRMKMIRQIVLCVLPASILFAARPGFSQVFFREYWAEFDKTINNNPHDTRTRVNDAQLSLHPSFGRRTEARINGLMMINVPEDLFGLDGADLYLELWGGHPLTENKRFILNGKQTYPLPNDGAEDNHCAYSYPLVALKVERLVNGLNALQFACDRGKTFWGHFIIDNAAVRCYLKPDHPDLVASGLKDFIARVKIGAGNVLQDDTALSLDVPSSCRDKVVSVDYFGRYLGFDDNGSRAEDNWHGFTQKRQFRNHLGHSSEAPFRVTWDTRLIPDQGKPVAVKARLTLTNGIAYWTPVRDGLVFPRDRSRVMLFKCTDVPRPFWSRDGNVREASMVLPDDLSAVQSATLVLRIWDGGEGTVKDHFKINGHAYTITSGKAIHDLVFTVAKVELSHLRPGRNTMTLLSDTEHHGIEMLLPGPCLVLRYK